MDFANFGANVYQARQTAKIARAQEEQNEILQAELGMIRFQQELAAIKKEQLIAGRNLILTLDEELERISQAYDYYPSHSSFMFDLLEGTFEESGLTASVFEEINDIDRFNKLTRNIRNTKRRVSNLTHEQLEIKNNLHKYSVEEGDLVDAIDLAKDIEITSKELTALTEEWDNSQDEWASLNQKNDLRRQKNKSTYNLFLLVSVFSVAVCYITTAMVLGMNNQEITQYCSITCVIAWVYPIGLGIVSALNPILPPNHRLCVLQQQIFTLKKELEKLEFEFKDIPERFDGLTNSADLEELRTYWLDYVDHHSPNELDVFENNEDVFERAPTTPKGPPIPKPNRNISGEFDDEGYEWIEYPSDSGNWFYREENNAEWQIWRD